MSSVTLERTDAAAPARSHMRQMLMRGWFLWLGAAILAVPTLVKLAQEYWSIETGGHGPIVLATGVWLLIRQRHAIAAVARPGDARITALLLVPALLGYVFARITGMLGIECMGVYVAFAAIFYFHAGWAAVRLLWFPLVYFLFMFPQPETLILPFSHVLKLGLSSAAVSLLSQFGYPVGHGGVVIYVDRYELLVATACSGLNSLIGLGAIGVFYAYFRFNGNWRASLPLLLVLPFIAVFANFIRVLLLILVTYYFGERVAQVYVHDVAGMMLFMLAMAMLLGADALIQRIRHRREVAA